MIFINTRNAFPLSICSGPLTIRAKRPLTDRQVEDIRNIACIELSKSVRKTAEYSSDHSLFIKSNKIKSLTKRLRVTSGIAKPFDYHLKELQNNVLIEKKSINSPSLIGHFLLKKWGIAHRAGLIFENLRDHVGAASYLKNNAQDTDKVIKNGIHLLNELIQKDIFHMDPRLENMMLDPQDISTITAIDFEHCYIGRPANKELMAGLVMGMFYRSGVEAMISESDFDGLVFRVFELNNQNNVFIDAYEASKPKFMERKACRRAFFNGRLD